MEAAIIAARSLNNVIGDETGIPWRVRDEQAMFRTITLGSTLIMGRKTFDTIGRSLPGRVTIIISRRQDYIHDECIVCHSLANAMARAESIARPVFVAGGGEIYRQALPLVNTVHLSTIQAEFNGNVHFPDFPTDDFVLAEEQFHESNIDYIYQRFQRRMELQ